MTLEFTLNRVAPGDARPDCVVVGAFSDGTLTPAAAALDGEGRIAALVQRGDIAGKTGQSQLLHDLPGAPAARVLVLGLGDKGKFGVAQYLKAVADAVRALKSGPVKTALFTLSELDVAGRDAAWNIRQAVVAADHAAYRYTATLGAKNKKRNETGLATFALQGQDEQALAQGKAIAAGVKFARELGNLPPNVCTPAYLAEQAQSFASRFDKAEAEILDEAQMDALGMGSLLAVARGSANRPRLVVLKWNNGGDAKPYVLVGKGITFDTGGVNLKTQGGIEEMKYDMCGAAAVLGTFVSAVGLALPINLVVIVPAVENAIDGNAYRP
ncbi:MAG: leucyl aminopeptidase, partial [Proteobacteria bacterium]|nr:leucyl aminopeptidase [Pseudomonadota bacterium]